MTMESDLEKALRMAKEARDKAEADKPGPTGAAAPPPGSKIQGNGAIDPNGYQWHQGAGGWEQGYMASAAAQKAAGIGPSAGGSTGGTGGGASTNYAAQNLQNKTNVNENAPGYAKQDALVAAGGKLIGAGTMILPNKDKYSLEAGTGLFRFFGRASASDILDYGKAVAIEKQGGVRPGAPATPGATSQTPNALGPIPGMPSTGFQMSITGGGSPTMPGERGPDGRLPSGPPVYAPPAAVDPFRAGVGPNSRPFEGRAGEIGTVYPNQAPTFQSQWLQDMVRPGAGMPSEGMRSMRLGSELNQIAINPPHQGASGFIVPDPGTQGKSILSNAPGNLANIINFSTAARGNIAPENPFGPINFMVPQGYNAETGFQSDGNWRPMDIPFNVTAPSLEPLSLGGMGTLRIDGPQTASVMRPDGSSTGFNPFAMASSNIGMAQGRDFSRMDPVSAAIATLALMDRDKLEQERGGGGGGGFGGGGSYSPGGFGAYARGGVVRSMDPFRGGSARPLAGESGGPSGMTTGEPIIGIGMFSRQPRFMVGEPTRPGGPPMAEDLKITPTGRPVEGFARGGEVSTAPSLSMAAEPARDPRTGAIIPPPDVPVYTPPAYIPPPTYVPPAYVPPAYVPPVAPPYVPPAYTPPAYVPPVADRSAPPVYTPPGVVPPAYVPPLADPRSTLPVPDAYAPPVADPRTTPTPVADPRTSPTPDVRTPDVQADPRTGGDPRITDPRVPPRDGLPPVVAPPYTPPVAAPPAPGPPPFSPPPTTTYDPFNTDLLAPWQGVRDRLAWEQRQRDIYGNRWDASGLARPTGIEVLSGDKPEGNLPPGMFYDLKPQVDRNIMEISGRLGELRAMGDVGNADATMAEVTSVGNMLDSVQRLRDLRIARDTASTQLPSSSPEQIAGLKNQLSEYAGQIGAAMSPGPNGEPPTGAGVKELQLAFNQVQSLILQAENSVRDSKDRMAQIDAQIASYEKLLPAGASEESLRTRLAQLQEDLNRNKKSVNLKTELQNLAKVGVPNLSSPIKPIDPFKVPVAA